MDCKHVEELLERYYNGQTTLEEESELRIFFLENDVPQQFPADKDLFIYQQQQQELTLGKEFEDRVLSLTEEKKARKPHSFWYHGLRPALIKSVAVVALVVISGSIIRNLFFDGETTFDYNYESYTDTYTDPDVAYQKVSSALFIVAKGINKTRDRYVVDSLSTAIERNIE